MTKIVSTYQTAHSFKDDTTPPRRRGKPPRCRFMQEATRLSSIADALHEAHEAYVEAMLKKQSRTALSEREEALLQESHEWLQEHKEKRPRIDSSEEMA